MANPQTAIGVGIRRNFATLGDRNFEPDQDTPVQYVCGKDHLEFLGSTYTVGQNLPFDVTGTSYSATAVELLQRYWNFGWCYPAT